MQRDGILNPVPKDNIPFSTSHSLYSISSRGTTKPRDPERAYRSSYLRKSFKITSNKRLAFTFKDFVNAYENEGIQRILITTGVPRSYG
ncbi:hypothetical protein NPIL_516901 [Nephila pilipes]|uniref:Uncharacterized protein n=1 Tax=Nephila pilipes TaxID=299642 RepID=A0A8X6QL57_NEPPI|nr:hypothetical protein NPIL_516901 [Nephila pilipes]